MRVYRSAPYCIVDENGRRLYNIITHVLNGVAYAYINGLPLEAFEFINGHADIPDEAIALARLIGDGW